jgi:hypothetical protein
MTEEELNRKFEFIANVLADVSIRQQKAEERAESAQKRMDHTDKRMDHTDKRMDRLERVLLLAIRAGRRERREWREHFAVLADSHMRLEAAMAQSQAHTDAAFAKLAESQSHTDRRLDALIDIVRARLNGEGK